MSGGSWVQSPVWLSFLFNNMLSMYGNTMAYPEICCQIKVHNLWWYSWRNCIVLSESSWQLLWLIIHKVMDRWSESIRSWNSTSMLDYVICHMIWDLSVRSNFLKVLLIVPYISSFNIMYWWHACKLIISLSFSAYRLFVLVDTFIRFSISREDRTEA